MLLVKQELLAALANTLESLSPGAGSKAAFESPKVAAHGDFASTAAMQLAKPLQRKPRELAEELSAALLATPAFTQWVEAIEIAGPGFLNIRLKTAAKQQVVREVLAAGADFGKQPAATSACWSSSSPPIRPGRCTSATGARPRWATPSATCSRRRATGLARVLLQRRRRADPDARAPARSCAPRVSSRATPDGPSRPTTANTSPTSPRTSGEEDRRSDDREYTASGDVEDLDAIRQFAVAYLRHEQDLDLKAFGVKFDNYYLEIQPLHQRPRRGDRGRAGRRRQDLRAGRRAVAANHRLRRRQGPRHAQGRRHATPTSCPTWPTTSPSGSAASTKVVNIQGTDHHGTIARVRAGLQARGRGHPAGLPGLRAAHHGARHARRRGGQDLQARRQLRDAARPDRMDQHATRCASSC